MSYVCMSIWYKIFEIQITNLPSLLDKVVPFQNTNLVYLPIAENPSVASHFFQGKVQTPSQDLTSYIFWPCLPPQLISPWACFPSFHQPVSVFDSSLCLLLLLGLLGMLLPLPEMFFPPSLAINSFLSSLSSSSILSPKKASLLYIPIRSHLPITDSHIF